jgi:predicted PurR-regulated permease PerM
VYVLAMASVIIGALYYIQQRVSKETFDSLFSIALIIIFMVVASTVFVGIWGENKLKEIEKGE